MRGSRAPEHWAASRAASVAFTGTGRAAQSAALQRAPNAFDRAEVTVVHGVEHASLRETLGPSDDRLTVH